MPGAVPHTSTYALTNATLPLVVDVAELGVRGALQRDPALMGGVTTVAGKITNTAVARSLGLEAVDPGLALA
jgi:alanine dehydrogenase